MNDGIKTDPQPSSEGLRDTLVIVNESLKTLQETVKSNEALKSEVEALKEKMIKLEQKPTKGIVTEGAEDKKFIFESAAASDDLRTIEKKHAGHLDDVFMYKKAQRESVFYPLNPSKFY